MTTQGPAGRPGARHQPGSAEDDAGPGALLAAALQGAIFALVKAVIDRGAAEAIRRFTGVWPGDNGEPSGEGA